jgi:multiple sugar transport system ATP-binding protein
MDEPLSNLDLKLREQMRTELKTLHARLKITTVYVTHDQTEALILSDRVVVMNGGIVEQAADPVSIYEQPANRFVAEFIGSPGINVVAGECTDLGCFVAGHRISASPAGIRGKVHVGVRPEHVVLGPPKRDAGLGGAVAFTEPYGSTAYAFVEAPAVEALLQTRKHIVASVEMHRPVRPGEAVSLSFAEDRLTLFDAVSGKALHHMPAAASAAASKPIAAE